MNKKTIMLFATVGMMLGGAAPMLWGDDNLIDATSILLGMVGGFIGVWFGVWISRRYL